MTDPLQYLRDMQQVSPAAARPSGLRAPTRPSPAPAPPSPKQTAFVDPHDLPALALALLAEGRPPLANPRFDRLPLQRRTLGDGTQCSLPIRYFDARCLIAAFSTELDKANALLTPVGLRAVAAEGGAASVLYGCFEYRDTDLGPYNEVGLSILAIAPGDATPALYVLNLPVTTPETDRIGRALWGYPKFVADIDVHGDARGFSTTLRDPASGTIATLAGACSALSPSPPAELPTYSVLDGRILRTLIDARMPFLEGEGAGFALKLGTSSHPMASNMRALGLDGASPSRVRYADPFQALLYPGFPV